MKYGTDKTEYTKHSALERDVLERIEREAVRPYARSWFYCREAFFWALIFIVIIIGAAAVAEVLFRVIHGGYSSYELTHGTLMRYVLDSLPLIWIGVLISAVALGHYNIRHTKKGYRYPLSEILLASIIMSVTLGAVLYRAGAAYVLDTELSKRLPFHSSVAKMNERLWQNPEEGLLFGTVNAVDDFGVAATVTSPGGGVYRLDVSELREGDLRLLRVGNEVRLVGMPGDTPSQFYVCHAFLYDDKKEKNLADVKRKRLAFLERMHEESPPSIRRLAQHTEMFGAERTRKVVPEGEEAMMSMDAVSAAAPEAATSPVDEDGSGEATSLMMTAPALDTTGMESSAFETETSKEEVRSTWCGSVRPTHDDLKRIIEERRAH